MVQALQEVQLRATALQEQLQDETRRRQAAETSAAAATEIAAGVKDGNDRDLGDSSSRNKAAAAELSAMRVSLKFRIAS